MQGIIQTNKQKKGLKAAKRYISGNWLENPMMSTIQFVPIRLFYGCDIIKAFPGTANMEFNLTNAALVIHSPFSFIRWIHLSFILEGPR